MTYNTRSPAVKRLMKEAQELSKATELFYAKPLEDNLFEWHFTIRGPSETDYDGGIYHGRILLPAEYPMKPPNILLMTPSGRFEINRKICLSISGYHPETWRPSWSIRTALLAIIGFMPTHGVGAIGSLEYPPEERRKLAKSSVEFVCPQCGGVKDMLKSLTEASVVDVEEAKNLASQITFTGDKEGDDKTLKKEGDKGKEEGVLTAVKEAPPVDRGPPLPSIQSCPPWSASPHSIMNAVQPLSFEEWCRQMQPACQGPIKGDDVTMPEVSSTSATVGSCAVDSASPPPTEHTETSATVLPSATAADRGEIRATEIRPSLSGAVSRESTVQTLQQRQTLLLQCMAVVAALLGLFLAVRLRSLGAVTEN